MIEIIEKRDITFCGAIRRWWYSLSHIEEKREAELEEKKFVEALAQLGHVNGRTNE